MSLIIMLSLLLAAHQVGVLAQSSESLTIIEHEPIIEESEKIELVPGGDGKLELATVQQITQMQIAEILGSPDEDTMAPNVVVTRWRGLQWSVSDFYNFTGRVGARTQTDTCVDRIYVKAKLKVTGPSGTFWGPTKSGSDSIPCRNDTGEKWTSWEPWIAYGSTLTSVADHEITANGQPFSWPNESGPSVTPSP